VLACGFLPDVLREALGDGEHAGVKLTYVTEPERRGTAGAIRFAADALGDDLDDRFLALNGDVLTDLDLSALMEAHREHEARATIALYPVEDSAAYGLVDVDGEGRVTEFVEKTGESVPGEINAGAYFLERSVLDLIPPGREVSIEREVFPLLVGDGLGALRLDGYWMDIGTPERYLQASWDILEGRVATQVRPTAPGLLIGAGAEVDAGATIGPRAVVSPGCRIAAGAELRESVLLDGCNVGAGARVDGSVLAAGVTVDAGAVLDDTIVGRGERVPVQ
jgi:mannose-1-phosphate guanylyltransferase